jgi:hypothetical protein
MCMQRVSFFKQQLDHQCIISRTQSLNSTLTRETSNRVLRNPPLEFFQKLALVNSRHISRFVISHYLVPLKKTHITFKSECYKNKAFEFIKFSKGCFAFFPLRLSFFSPFFSGIFENFLLF